MLDSDLAELYEVETKALNRAAKRNEDRFPEDFRFKLTREELDNLRYQIGTLAGKDTDPSIGSTYLPHVYTEQGVPMLSGVLRSKVAINHHCALALAVDFPEERPHVVALRIEHPDNERPPVVAFKKDHPVPADHVPVPRVDTVERAQRRPGSRDVGEQLCLLDHGVDQAPRRHGACELGLDVVDGGFEVVHRRGRPCELHLCLRCEALGKDASNLLGREGPALVGNAFAIVQLGEEGFLGLIALVIRDILNHVAPATVLREKHR